MTLTVVVVLFSSWFVVRWYIGNTARVFHPEEHRLKLRRCVRRLAPSVPHWRLGNLCEASSGSDFPVCSRV